MTGTVLVERLGREHHIMVRLQETGGRLLLLIAAVGQLPSCLGLASNASHCLGTLSMAAPLLLKGIHPSACSRLLQVLVRVGVHHRLGGVR